MPLLLTNPQFPVDSVDKFCVTEKKKCLERMQPQWNVSYFANKAHFLANGQRTKNKKCRPCPVSENAFLCNNRRRFLFNVINKTCPYAYSNGRRPGNPPPPPGIPWIRHCPLSSQHSPSPTPGIRRQLVERPFWIPLHQALWGGKYKVEMLARKESVATRTPIWFWLANLA